MDVSREDIDPDDVWREAKDLFPDDYNYEVMTPEYSGKMILLSQILQECHKIGDRVVVVSNFTTVFAI